MSFLVDIRQLKSAINLARNKHPAIDHELQADVSALAEIYGRIIYQNVDMADLDCVPSRIKLVVAKWL